MLDIKDILNKFNDITIKNSNQIKNSLDLKRALLKSIDTIYQQQKKCENCSKEDISKSKLFDIEFEKQKKKNLQKKQNKSLKKERILRQLILVQKKERIKEKLFDTS